MPELAIFIDAAYLDKVCQHEFGGIEIDYEALVAEMTRQVPLFRVYYCDSLPYQGNPPTKDESSRMSGKQRFFTYLERLPRFEVRLGTCVKRTNADGSNYYLQKGVDVHLAVDMVRLAMKGRITDVALITGDADLLPAVAAAREEGVIVHLYHGRVCPKTLWNACDERVQFNRDMMNRVARP